MPTQRKRTNDKGQRTKTNQARQRAKDRVKDKAEQGKANHKTKEKGHRAKDNGQWTKDRGAKGRQRIHPVTTNPSGDKGGQWAKRGDLFACDNESIR
jgi:hypothetical protein